MPPVPADICGNTARTHVIFHSEDKDDNLLVKKDVRVERDQLTHVYTLHVKVGERCVHVFLLCVCIVRCIYLVTGRSQVGSLNGLRHNSVYP